ncbi:MAG: response regulator [bacterium]
MENTLKQIPILIIDDNEDDIFILQRAFKRVKILNEIFVVRSGEEAVDFIYHQGKYADKKSPTPGLILLDISMPKIDGFAVLKKLKADPIYKKIPVIMLTTSSREEDIVRSYEDGACSYITKPTDFNEFMKAIERFEVYWTLVVKIP